VECANCDLDSILDMEYLFHVNRGSTIRPHDNGIVAVIDGSKLTTSDLH
jgi:hypothetical protein